MFRELRKWWENLDFQRKRDLYNRAIREATDNDKLCVLLVQTSRANFGEISHRYQVVRITNVRACADGVLNAHSFGDPVEDKIDGTDELEVLVKALQAGYVVQGSFNAETFFGNCDYGGEPHLHAKIQPFSTALNKKAKKLAKTKKK